MAIRQAAGANALDTADAVKAKLKEMSNIFPQGMKVVYPYDTTPFVKVAIKEVVMTLFEAILLVFLIMWLFMGNIRATLIPTLQCRWYSWGPSRCWTFSAFPSIC